MIALIVSVSALLVLPAQSTAPTPRPTPEVERLGVFIGEWKLQEDGADSPNRTICQWSPNHQCLLCDQIHPGPGGTSVKELNVFTYDRTTRGYVMQGMRPTRTVPFTIDGQTWTYPSQRVEDGKTIHTRVLNTWPTPSQMHYTVQSSTDAGAHWTTNAEGTMLRTNATPPTTTASHSPNAALDAIAHTRQLTREPHVTTSTCGWSPNEAFLICDQMRPDDVNVITVYWYSDTDLRYHCNTISPHNGSTGGEEMSPDGKTWVKTSEGAAHKVG
jgi:hypothetical protein